MKIFIVCMVVLMSKMMFCQKKKTQNPSDLHYEIVSLTSGGFIQNIKIHFGNHKIAEPEFIYIMMGNLVKNECQKFNVNFKLGSNPVNKYVRLVAFNGTTIELDISHKRLKRINSIMFYYSNPKRNYSDPLYFNNTKQLLEDIVCN